MTRDIRREKTQHENYVPDPTEATTQTSREMSPQNDIADILGFLAGYLPDGMIKDALLDLAEWFENLSQNEEFRAQAEQQGIDVQGLLDGDCLNRVANQLREIVNTAVLNAVTELPKVLETFIGCLMGAPVPASSLPPAPRELTPEEEASLTPQQRRLHRREVQKYKELSQRQQAQPQSGLSFQANTQINLSCVIQAGMVYFQTRDITKALGALLACQFGGGTGGGGTGGGGIGGGLGGFLNNPVVRCQA